jgi:DNA repair exonuclease SbcCD ATPase subunit
MWMMLVSFVVLGVAGLGSTVAQTSGSTATGEDLGGIHAALVRIADALERQEVHQKVELLIKRIEVHEKRLEPVQRRLAESEKVTRQAETDYKRVERMQSDMERTLRAQADLEQDVGPGSGMQPMLQELAKQVDAAREQFEVEQERLRELERQLNEGRQAISVLDKELDELLAQ